MPGWIKLEKKITAHWLWQEEFSRGQAWIDLLLHANYKDSSLMIKGHLIKLRRGQQARSEVTLAETWGWSRGKVRRFLKLLKTEQMVVQHSVQVTSVITVCKYDEYQPSSKSGSTADGTVDGTAGGTVDGTAGGTQLRSKEVKEVKKKETDSPIRSAMMEGLPDFLQ